MALSRVRLFDAKLLHPIGECSRRRPRRTAENALRPVKFESNTDFHAKLNRSFDLRPVAEPAEICCPRSARKDRRLGLKLPPRRRVRPAQEEQARQEIETQKYIDAHNVFVTSITEGVTAPFSTAI